MSNNVVYLPEDVILANENMDTKGDIRAVTGKGDTKFVDIHDGDEVILGVVKSEKAFSQLELITTGAALVTVFFNDKKAGELEIPGVGGMMQSGFGKIACPAGAYELKLKFAKTTGFELVQAIVR